MTAKKRVAVKIKKAVVENIKKIKFAEITPENDLIIITGGNGQGKSSFTDGIFSVFGGKEALPKIPLNAETGKTKGSTKVVLTNGLTLTREVTTKGTALKITDESGKSVKAPQQYVNERLSLFSFNPMEFSDSDEKERLDYAKRVLRMVVGMDPPSEARETIGKYTTTPEYQEITKQEDTIIDTIDNLINNNNGLLYLRRRDLNREIKTLEGAIQSDLKDYSEEIAGIESMFDGKGSYYGEQYVILKDAAEKAIKINEEMHNFSNAYDKLIETLPSSPKTHIMQEIASWGNHVKAGKEYMEKVVHHQKAKIKEDEQTIIETREKLTRLKALQESYEKNRGGYEKLEKVKALQELCDKDLEFLRKTKEQILKEVKFPVDNMVLEDDDVYIDGLPFSQKSQSERLIISIKLAIALNPELRVMRVLNGNLLDANTFEELKGIIQEKDFQLWIEWVNVHDTGVGYFFQNGEIKKTGKGKKDE